MSSQNTSHTQIDAFAECERKHYYMYGEKITPVEDNENASRGNLIHLALSEYYKGLKSGLDHSDSMDRALQAFIIDVDKYDVSNFDQFRNEALSLLVMYWDRWEAEDRKLKVVDAEVAYDVKLTDDVDITVIIDLLAEIPGHGLIALDHKTTYDFYRVDKVDMSFQLPRYMAALNSMGIAVDGVWFNEIRYRTTADNRANPHERFRRTPVPITTNKVVTIMREHLLAAHRISQLQSTDLEGWESRVIRNPAACQYCNLKSVCDADLTGQDQRIIRERFYKPRGRRPQAVSEHVDGTHALQS